MFKTIYTVARDNASIDYESIFIYFQSMLDEATDPWGVKVERVEV